MLDLLHLFFYLSNKTSAFLYIYGEGIITQKVHFHPRTQGKYQRALRHRRESKQTDIKEIGCGAYGKVYTARKKDKASTVRAVKMIKKQYNNSQFTSEVLILKMLDHPNLLKLYEIFEDKSCIYLVTE